MAHLFTIWYGNQNASLVIERLKKNGVTCLVDVRSSPYSKWQMTLNKDKFQKSLEQGGLSYIYAWKYLWGLDKNNEKPEWQVWIDRLKKIITDNPQNNYCIMCAEFNYRECHRYYWISKDLQDDVEITHILKDGTAEPHSKILPPPAETISLF